MEQQGPKASVLVVDDDPAICQLLKAHLTQEGYKCRSASSGDEAIRQFEKQGFDAVISDLQMPGMSGLQLLEKLHNRHSHTAFLMATGVDDVRVGVQAMKQGAADYLVKPFQLEAVTASLERSLDRKRLEIEVENYRQNLENMVGERTQQLLNAMKHIELTYDETLEALGAALDLRDNDTAGHSRRVTGYSLVMARSHGCTEDELKHIARGAYLHDIGKIGIPDSILLKPGKLTEDETRVMQSHAQLGYELANCIAFLAPAAEIVLTHQERFDGSGYPRGLSGEAIPFGARVFAVADTMDAMTSDRPYRRALPFSAAREEIVRGSGRQFDPKVVDIYLDVPMDVWERIRAEGTVSRFHAAASRFADPAYIEESQGLN